jgi:hypothetical protein
MAQMPPWCPRRTVRPATSSHPPGARTGPSSSRRWHAPAPAERLSGPLPQRAIARQPYAEDRERGYRQHQPQPWRTASRPSAASSTRASAHLSGHGIARHPAPCPRFPIHEHHIAVRASQWPGPRAGPTRVQGTADGHDYRMPSRGPTLALGLDPPIGVAMGQCLLFHDWGEWTYIGRTCPLNDCYCDEKTCQRCGKKEYRTLCELKYIGGYKEECTKCGRKHWQSPGA